MESDQRSSLSAIEAGSSDSGQQTIRVIVEKNGATERVGDSLNARPGVVGARICNRNLIAVCIFDQSWIHRTRSCSPIFDHGSVWQPRFSVSHSAADPGLVIVVDQRAVNRMHDTVCTTLGGRNITFIGVPRPVGVN